MSRSPSRSARTSRARSRDPPHRSSGRDLSRSRSRSPAHRSPSHSPVRSRDQEKEIRKSRKRKRAMDQEKQRKHASHLEEKAVALGRKIGRMGDMWFSFKSIFEHAMERKDAPEDMGYTNGEDQLYGAFLAINDQVPSIMKIIEDVADEDWAFFCAKLDMGRGRARNEDTSTLTTKASWYDGNIPDKTRNAGFKNAFCATQLCPVTLDINKPDVRKPLEDGHLIPSPSDSPALLYADEKYNPDDPLEGYLKNKYLVYGARAILLGPTAARGRAGSTAKNSGNAHKHGITSISFPFIAYVACLHHFVCLDQETFSAGGEPSGWPYAEFYRSILGVVACMSDGQKDGLIKWWNQQVFGGIPREMLAGTVQGQPSQMDRMKEYLKSQNGSRAASAGS